MTAASQPPDPATLARTPLQHPSTSTAELADYYYSWVHSHLISRQTPALGLFPRSKSSYITDNVYCAVTIWALSKVFGRLNDGTGRYIELEQTAIKTMRAILFCFSKQLDKLEQFKYQQDPKFCLHTKFDSVTGDELPQHYQHMQIRSVSLYLFYLSQMIRSGLVLIYTLQECHIIQNLIYYIERAYRIRDFGMWGQGRRDSPDQPELSASSIGITVAALKVCDGLNVFGEGCSNETVLFVDPDAEYRNVAILHSLLPSESRSKDVDAALIMTKGFPAFVVENPQLGEEIEKNVNSELLGTYGYRRFIGDRVGLDLSCDTLETGNDDSYFGMECEWPFIVFFQIMTCIFEGRTEDVPKYRSIINPLLYDSKGYPAVPQYFCFKKEVIARVAVKDFPIIVFQAFLILTELLEKQLVFPHELDYRRQKIQNHTEARTPVVQIALLSESTSFQALLSTYGITTQTPNQIESVYIWPSTKLVDLLYHHGSDETLGLTGRPKRPLGSLCASRVWQVGGKTVMCIPLYQDKQDFYISKDETFVAKAIKVHIKFLKSHWRGRERPTFCILLTSALFKKNSKPLLKVLDTLKDGAYKDILIKLGRLQELITVARKVEILNVATGIDFHANRILDSPVLNRRSLSMKSLTDSEPDTDSGKDTSDKKERENYMTMFTDCQSLSENALLNLANSNPPSATNIIALTEIANRHGPECLIDGETVTDIVEHYYKAMENDWLALRCCAGFLGKTVDSLAPSLSAVIVSGRSLSLGVHGQPEILIEGPKHPTVLQEILHNRVRKQNLLHVSLQQEFLIYIAELLVDHPELFKGILIIRVGSMIHVLESVLAPKGIVIETLPPHVLSKEIRHLLTHSCGSWQQHRLINGTLGRVPHKFYSRVWFILRHQNIRFVSRDATLVSHDAKNTKPCEPLFAMKVEQFLNNFSPEHRYFVIELFHVLACTIERNQEVNLIEDFQVIDFIEKSEVKVDDSSEAVSKKFVNCLIKNEYVKLINVDDCIIS